MHMTLCSVVHITLWRIMLVTIDVLQQKFCTLAPAEIFVGGGGGQAQERPPIKTKKDPPHGEKGRK